MSSSRLSHALLIAALAVVPTLLVRPREFTNWDDRLFVSENVAVQHPTGKNLLYLATHPVAGNLIPITMLTFVVDWQLYGSNAWGFALTNALLYAAGCLLLVRVLERSGISRDVALLAGALFAVHPAHVENVSWISGRKDLVCFVLLLGCQLAYMEHRRDGNRRARWLSVGLLLLAGLAKPIAMSAAPALFLYDVLILRRRAVDSIRALWPHAAVSGVILCLAFWSQADAAAIREVHDVRWGSIDLAGATLLIDFLRSFVPFPFSPYYPRHIVSELPGALRWGAAAIVTVMSLGLLMGGRRSAGLRTAAYFWWVALAFLVPVSGIVPLGSTSLADRYLLIPSVGSCLLIAWCAFRIPRRSAVVAAYGAVTVLAMVFHLRALHWSNSVRLWESVTEKYPTAALGWKNLTTAHYQRGDMQQAAEAALAGVEHQPEEISLVRNASEILMQMGRLQEVERLIDRGRRAGAEARDMDLLAARLALHRGEASMAVEILTEAVDHDADWVDAWSTLSYAWEQLGDLERATAAAERALQSDPRGAEHYRRLLSLLQTRHDWDGMLRVAATANRELPHLAEAWQVRISVLRRMGRTTEADQVAAEARAYVPMPR